MMNDPYDEEASTLDESDYDYEEVSDDDDDDDEMNCNSSSRHCSEGSAMTDENANPNAPPSPPRVRKSPSWHQDPSRSSPSTSRYYKESQKKNYTTSIEELLPIMAQKIADVTEALGIPKEAAAPLLRQHKWNKNRVLEDFMGCPERLLAKAGVTHRCNPLPVTTTVSECLICMETMAEDGALAMPCGHSFCLDCWESFLTNAIQHEGATCMNATCPEASCREIITEAEVSNAAPDLLERYQQYQIARFVEDNGRWCPGKGCDRVALPTGDLVADCDKCGTRFCSGCSGEPHAPVDCENLRKWVEKGVDESETVNWMTVNTKNCPKCASRIEKNGGCMYVTCRKCHHGFCWQCMGTHHVWQCNAYKEEDDGKLRAKNELERYMHYYNRFIGHNEAQKYALKQLNEKKANQKQSEDKDEQKKAAEAKQDGRPTDNNHAAIDDDGGLPDFLKDANQQLVNCRRVLKYTYVFAFYHFVDPSRKKTKESFEFHQGMLEGLTEGLSKATEKSLSEIDRQEVVDRTRATDQLIKNVLAHVDDGMDESFDD